MNARAGRMSRRSALVLLTGGFVASWPVLSLAAEGDTTGAGASESERVVVEIGDSPTLGPATAHITIVEFADFRCRFCAYSARALRRVLRIYPDQIRWVFKHRPLGNLEDDGAAPHFAAQAAHAQGKFWEISELIFRNQARLGQDDLLGYARSLDLDMTAFAQALDRPRTRGRVARDALDARRLKVAVTPTYFVNGRRMVGAQTFDEWRQLVEKELAATQGPAPIPPTGRQ
jgi:protein-disulfide isomerase